jgi:hypothetical protein
LPWSKSLNKSGYCPWISPEWHNFYHKFWEGPIVTKRWVVAWRFLCFYGKVLWFRLIEDWLVSVLLSFWQLIIFRWCCRRWFILFVPSIYFWKFQSIIVTVNIIYINAIIITNFMFLAISYLHHSQFWRLLRPLPSHSLGLNKLFEIG